MQLPAVAKAVSVYSGMVKQMSLDATRGTVVLARPRLLEQPDPNGQLPWFLQVNVEDYLCEGNALQLVTARDAMGWPAATAWVPAAWVDIAMTGRPYPDDVVYMVGGVALPRADIIHIRRGSDRWCTARGVGMVEQLRRDLVLI
jgi:hypothetical protein